MISSTFLDLLPLRREQTFGPQLTASAVSCGLDRARRLGFVLQLHSDNPSVDDVGNVDGFIRTGSEQSYRQVTWRSFEKS